MSNPRPCKWCGRPEAQHRMGGPCLRYEGVERKRPIVAMRRPTSIYAKWSDIKARRLGEPPQDSNDRTLPLGPSLEDIFHRWMLDADASS